MLLFFCALQQNYSMHTRRVKTSRSYLHFVVNIQGVMVNHFMAVISNAPKSLQI